MHTYSLSYIYAHMCTHTGTHTHTCTISWKENPFLPFFLKVISVLPSRSWGWKPKENTFPLSD